MISAIGADQTVFNVRQAAAYLQIGPRVLRRLLRQKQIVYRKVDDRGTVRIAKIALDDYLLRRTGGAQ